MGTNYYRIPKEDEMLGRKQKLIEKIEKLELSPLNIQREFKEQKDDAWDSLSAWDYFIDDLVIHLGKRSGGWKFCWNFHDNKYYSNKAELLEYIRSGRVVDEYGEEQNVEEFIDMALSWGQPDGLVVNEDYRKKKKMEGIGDFFLDAMYDDKIIDGLRVSSATDFC